MSRIRKAYENQFRALLQQVRARRLEQGVQWLWTRSQQISHDEAISMTFALDRVHLRLREQVGSLPEMVPARARPTCFLCDAGLGGLARWLRAAGHAAIWQSDIADAELVREARRLSATILTTDSLLMERRLLREGLLPALWLPPTLTIAEQLVRVFREFRLVILAPRCMRCGGELCPVNKEAVRDRIPPKTYRWLNEYFRCSRCDQLFWHGTHWQRIQQRLRELGR